MVRLPRNEKQTHRLNSGPQMWSSGLTLSMTLTLNFQGQIWNSLYLSQKWCDCHETKSKHIDWSQGLKCDHRVWPWPWPWLLIFKVKYGICYISATNCLIVTKRKANISIELQASNVTNGFDLGHDLDIWIFKVKCDFDHLVTKVRCKDLPDSNRGDFRCRRAVDSSCLVIGVSGTPWNKSYLIRTECLHVSREVVLVREQSDENTNYKPWFAKIHIFF